MSEIKKLSELGSNQLSQAVGVFVEGFYNILSSITKDKGKLHDIFKHSLNRNANYAYLQNGQAVGFLGIRDSESRPLKLNKEVFLASVGGLAGKFAYKMTSSALENVPPPKPNETYIDYLAIAPAHRGQGIGTKLIEYAKDSSQSEYLMIQVLSKNVGAKKLYERRGFSTVEAKINLLTMLKCFGRPITMKMKI
ncbi:MAG: GNAT family N-acetyltransferase [Defluviitaleaceae bacterium]|nr:GNAT family N-acetyltransferase [Defluviitaleaceae bacterium]